MRRAVLTAALFALAATPAAGKFHPSHRLVATGPLVDHWTVDDPEDCGPVGPCQIGLLEAFGRPSWAVAGTRDGELLIRMPKPSKLRAKKVVRVTGTDHQRTTYGNFTDDVTR